MSNNRRIRRLQDRMMKKPKFVEALRRFNDLPTNDELEAYVNRKVEEAKRNPTTLIKPINPSEEMLRDFEQTKPTMDYTDIQSIKSYYKIDEDGMQL